MTKQCGCGYWFSYSPMNEVRAKVASGCISLFPPSVKFSNWCKSTISLTIVPLKLLLRRLCRVVLRVSASSSSCAMVMVTPRVSFDVERLLNGTQRPRGSVKCLPSSSVLIYCEKLSFQFKPKEPNFGIDQQSPNPDDPKMAPLR